MDLLADILLALGALGAGFYCFTLAKRLESFNSLEKGVGGAVAALSSQVDDLNRSLVGAKVTSEETNQSLIDLINRAEAASQHLELLLASMHDVSGAPSPPFERSEHLPCDSLPIFARRNQTSNGTGQ